MSTDTLDVDAIYELLNTVIMISLMGGSAFFVFHLLKTKKFKSAKTDIQNLQARLSQLRLALKAKVKRKSNVLRTMSKTAIVEGDFFDNTVKNLCDVKFENSEDFQSYFDLSRQIVNMIYISCGGEGMAPQTSENNYMSNDFKTEMDIIRIIKEMIELSAKVNVRVDEHNRTSSQKLSRVDNIVFGSISEINRVFKAEDGSSHAA